MTLKIMNLVNPHTVDTLCMTVIILADFIKGCF